MASIRARQGKDGKTIYQAQVRIKKYPPRSATFSRKSDAKLWAAQTETDIRTGMTIRTDAGSQHTVAEMLQRYSDTTLLEKSGGAKAQKAFNDWWCAELGHYALSEVTTDLVTRSLDKLKKTSIAPRKVGGPTKSPEFRAPATILRYLMFLSHAFTVARKQWQWCNSSPVENVQRPRIKNSRARYLSETERDALLSACKESPNGDIFVVVVLAISTGMRKGEIMGLRWRDIHHLEDRNISRIQLTKTKTDQDRFVPLASEALDLLTFRKDELLRGGKTNFDDELIFPSSSAPNQPVDLRKAWLSALNASQVKGFRFHDLRHTAASYLAMEGTSLLAISKVLGHATTKMTERYAHLAESHIDEAVRKMNEKKFGSTARGP